MSGATVWITGLPCSGKSTVAARVAEALRARGRRVEVLDGDVVRARLSPNLGFSREDRDAHVRRIGFICELLSRQDVVAIAAVISPYRDVREELRRGLAPRFVEVWTSCPVEVCEARDVKGLYRRARAGEVRGFTGVDDPYEPPLAAEVVLRTDRETPEESARRVLEALPP